MRFRKLRIAFSVTCGIACVLLIVLWVRSYWSDDSVNHATRLASPSGQISAHLIGCRSFHGTIRFLYVPDTPLIRELPQYGWQVDSHPIELGFGEVLPSMLTFEREKFGSDGFAITVPDWVMVVILAALAGAPWLRWPKKFSRFTLRTLLIATTLVAVVLGLVVWLVR